MTEGWAVDEKKGWKRIRHGSTAFKLVTVWYSHTIALIHRSVNFTGAYVLDRIVDLIHQKR